MRDGDLYEFETNGTQAPWDEREWLLTDGTGSFAMGTVSGIASRRYHSLLNAAMVPPVGRINTVARMGEILLIDGQVAMHELSACRFTGEEGGSVHPKGFKHLRKFTQTERSVTWSYAVDGVRVEKTLTLPANSGRAELTYDVSFDGGRWVELLLLPMMALRDFHALRRHAGWNMGVKATARSVRVDADGHAVKIEGSATGAVDQALRFEASEDWWFGHQYAIETERGQDDTEDLFKPGVFRVTLRGPGKVTLGITPDPEVRKIGSAFPRALTPVGQGPATAGSVSSSIAGSSIAGSSIAGSSAAVAPLAAGSTPSLSLRRLLHATDAFLARRRTPTGDVGTTVMAGFPWFADWGRDTFISLPGLLLTTGRLKEAEAVLKVFAHYVSEGMIPNKFDDYTNEPEYNTVDASLWFIHAAHAFVEAGGDKGVFERELLPACRKILEGYRDGTRYGIRMDPADGLMLQGDANTQLTWMDAKYNGRAFTPRQGKAVEINALWYHTLKLLGETALAQKVKASFRQKYPIAGGGPGGLGLYDVVDGEAGSDSACRPNQIFAVSLEADLLTPEQQKAVLTRVQKELLTPYGLRSLAQGHEWYHPTYGGPQSQRDEAYHNGTVWGWLIGPFLDAYLTVHGDNRTTREEIRRMLAPLLQHLEEACIGSISEIFEAAPPHRPVGAPAQAWSVAEVLRIAVKVGV